jgi:hypothetical protein
MEQYKVTDPMRLFTLVVSALFVAIGVMAIASGNSDGWLIAGFFGLCLLVAIFEPWFSKPWVTCDYRLVMTDDEIACEHPKRQREAIRWEDVNRIWYVTTSDGPRLPDEWLLLEERTEVVRSQQKPSASRASGRGNGARNSFLALMT